MDSIRRVSLSSQSSSESNDSGSCVSSKLDLKHLPDDVWSENLASLAREEPIFTTVLHPIDFLYSKSHSTPPSPSLCSSASSTSSDGDSSPPANITCLAPGIFKSGDGSDTNCVPLPLDNLYILHYTGGALWVDKTRCIAAVRERPTWWMHGDRGAVFVRRPSGFGKSAFASALAVHYDVCHAYCHGKVSPYDRMIKNSAIHAKDDGLDDETGNSLLLHLDLAFISSFKVEDFEEDLRSFLDRELEDVIAKYWRKFGFRPEDGYPSVYRRESHINLSLVASTAAYNGSLILIVDNFEHPLERFKYDRRVVDALRTYLSFPLAGSVRSGVILSSMPADTPYTPGSENLAECEGLLSGLAVDMTDHPAIADAFGFTVEEVTKICRLMGVGDVAESLISSEKAYQFSVNGPSMYSMLDVLDKVWWRTHPEEVESDMED